MSPSPLESLSAEWEQRREMWSCYSITVLAYREADEWKAQAVVATGLLEPRCLSEAVRVETPDVWIWRGIFDAAGFHALLRDLATQSHLDIGGRNLALDLILAGGLVPGLDLWASVPDADDLPRGDRPDVMRCIQFEVWGASPPQAQYEGVRQRVRETALHFGARSPDGWLTAELGLRYGESRSPLLRVVLPYGLRATLAALPSGGALLSVSCGKPLRSDRLEVRAGSTNVFSQAHDLTPSPTVPRDPYWEESQVEVSHGWHLWLRHPGASDHWIGVPVPTQSVTTMPSLRGPAFEVLHEGRTPEADVTRFLTSLLRDNKKDATQFERLVLNLLVSLGCAVYHAPQKTGFDLVAFEDTTQTALCVSVTISNDLAKKVQTLLSSRDRLRAALAGWTTVAFLVVTPCAKDQIPPSALADAAERGIGLLTKEGLLQTAADRPSASDLWKRIAPRKRSPLEEAFDQPPY